MKKVSLLILALIATTAASGNAQTLRVRLLNGSSGKPIENAYINVWVGDQRKGALPIPVDRSGNAALSLISADAKDRVKASGPTFLYAPEVEVQVGLVLCQIARQKYSWLQITHYSTEELKRTGIVTKNTCGKAVAKPEPGVLTIFVRPLTFWETLSQ